MPGSRTMDLMGRLGREVTCRQEPALCSGNMSAHSIAEPMGVMIGNVRFRNIDRNEMLLRGVVALLSFEQEAVQHLMVSGEDAAQIEGQQSVIHRGGFMTERTQSAEPPSCGRSHLAIGTA